MSFIFKIILTCILAFFATGIEAQDAHYSQFFANRLYLNPSFAGIEDSRRISINYRNQWPLSNSPFVSYNASYDQYVEPLHGGIGISVYNDNQGKGTISEFGLNAIYSYHLHVSRTLSINAGFQASFVQRSLNGKNFIFGDMLNRSDGTIGRTNESGLVFGKNNRAYPDFGFGLTAFYKDLYSGMAMFHLLKPNHSISYDPEGFLPRKFTFFAGGLFPVYEKRLGKEVLKLSPNMVYIQQGIQSQINSGLEFIFKNGYFTGLWFRQNLGFRLNTIVATAGVSSDKIRFRYSYDYQLSHPSIALPDLGAHEISMIILMESEKKKNRRTIKCLKI